MYIADFSAGQFGNLGFALFYPTLVHEVVVREGRFYEYFDIFLAAFLDGYGCLLACFSCEEAVPVLSCFDFISVNACDDVACLEFRISDGQYAVREYFLDFQAVTLIILVVEDSESSHIQTASVLVASSCMGSIELTENFGKKLLEIEVVVYVREELRVVLLVVIPVHSMKARVVEFLFHLFPHVVEDVFSLSLRLELIVS